ncbi:MAG: hypothetical protein DMG65_09435 [Candidatus Angelobacter sp. Gp1-AA117]|nr:MAG: hypothetical protein DMG65_09435 [Candidatus Angelobacter sp. Gp1-AA117]
MAKKLKVISVNFPFKNVEVAQESRLSTSRALFDFDVVVIRPYTLPPVDGPEYPITGYQAEMRDKRPELIKLLEQGGLLIVILNTHIIREYDPGRWSYWGGGTIYTVSNYDFIDEDFSHCVKNGTGNKLEYIGTENAFTNVLRASSVQWTAYLEGRLPSPFDDVRISARNSAKSFVGGWTDLNKGRIVFLPNLITLDEAKFFDACREYMEGKEGLIPPEWIHEIFIPGESELMASAIDVRQKIAALDSEAERIEEQIRTLKQHQKLLYEKGKNHLEPAVRAAFDLIEFKTTPSEHIPGTNYEIDGRTNEGSQRGLLEVKGSKRQIVLDELSPFILKVLSDQEKSGFRSKGILVANGLCEQPPETRLGDCIFSSHVLQASHDNSIALVNTAELYCVLCGVLSREIKDFNAIRERILTTRGYVDLRSFCGKSPFKLPKSK